MNQLVAVGAYLQTIRLNRGIGRVSLAAAVGTNESQIIRIEAGDLDTRGSLLFAIIGELRIADPNDVLALFQNPNSTAEDGVEVANKTITQAKSQDLIANAQLQAVLREADLFLEHDRAVFVDELSSFGKRLVSILQRRKPARPSRAKN